MAFVRPCASSILLVADAVGTPAGEANHSTSGESKQPPGQPGQSAGVAPEDVECLAENNFGCFMMFLKPLERAIFFAPVIY